MFGEKLKTAIDAIFFKQYLTTLLCSVIDPWG